MATKATTASLISIPKDAPIIYIDPKTLMVSENRFSEKKEDKEFSDLCQSLRKNGQIQPVIFYTDGKGGRHLVTGHQRRRACIEMEMFVLAVEVPMMLEEQRLMIDAQSNIETRLLSPMDRAQRMNTFKSKYKWSGKKLADFFHCSEGLVSQYMSLLQLHPNVQALCDTKKKDGNGYVVGLMEAQGAKKLTTAEQLSFASQKEKDESVGIDDAAVNFPTTESGTGTNTGTLNVSGGTGGSGKKSQTLKTTKAYGLSNLKTCLDAVMEKGKLPLAVLNTLETVRACIARKMNSINYDKSLSGFDFAKEFKFVPFEDKYEKKAKGGKKKGK